MIMSDAIDWSLRVRLTCESCGFVSVCAQAVLDGHVERIREVFCPRCLAKLVDCAPCMVQSER